MTIESLREFGANVEEGVARCANNEAFYLRMMDILKKEQGFGKLEAAVQAGNLKEGFEAAHALKGVLGNLSLTPLYEPVAEITELLRAETDMDYAPILEVIRTRKEQFDKL